MMMDKVTVTVFVWMSLCVCVCYYCVRVLLRHAHRCACPPVLLLTVKKKLESSTECVYRQDREREGQNESCSHLTLTGTSANVGDEASSAGVWLGWALLAGVAPCSSNGSAAKGLGADDSTELALTHLVVHLRETWPSPVVCVEKSKNPLLVRGCFNI